MTLQRLTTAFCLLSIVFLTSSGSSEAHQNLNAGDQPNPNHLTPNDNSAQTLSVKDCKTSYSPYCIKMTLIKLIGRGGSFNLPVFPGVSINSPGLSDGMRLQNAFQSEPEQIDDLLLNRLSEYFSTMSINVKVMDKNAPLKIARALEGEDPKDDSLVSSRKKDRYGGAMVAAGLMAGGTTLALGLAALAAMSGKALMASLLALMLAALSALKGGGGGGEKTTYEIVAKPVVSHSSSHTSEVQHGHGGHYYKRSIDAQPLPYASYFKR